MEDTLVILSQLMGDITSMPLSTSTKVLQNPLILSELSSEDENQINSLIQATIRKQVYRIFCDSTTSNPSAIPSKLFRPFQEIIPRAIAIHSHQSFDNTFSFHKDYRVKDALSHVFSFLAFDEFMIASKICRLWLLASRCTTARRGSKLDLSVVHGNSNFLSELTCRPFLWKEISSISWGEADYPGITELVAPLTSIRKLDLCFHCDERDDMDDSNTDDFDPLTHELTELKFRLLTTLLPQLTDLSFCCLTMNDEHDETMMTTLQSVLEETPMPRLNEWNLRSVRHVSSCQWMPLMTVAPIRSVQLNVQDFSAMLTCEEFAESVMSRTLRNVVVDDPVGNGMPAELVSDLLTTCPTIAQSIHKIFPRLTMYDQPSKFPLISIQNGILEFDDTGAVDDLPSLLLELLYHPKRMPNLKYVHSLYQYSLSSFTQLTICPPSSAQPQPPGINDLSLACSLSLNSPEFRQTINELFDKIVLPCHRMRVLELRFDHECDTTQVLFRRNRKHHLALMLAGFVDYVRKTKGLKELYLHFYDFPDRVVNIDLVNALLDVVVNSSKIVKFRLDIRFALRCLFVKSKSSESTSIQDGLARIEDMMGRLPSRIKIFDVLLPLGPVQREGFLPVKNRKWLICAGRQVKPIMRGNMGF